MPLVPKFDAFLGELREKDTAFANFKTIGTGGDYADVQAMLGAGFYRCVFISNVTEDSNVTPDANGLWVDLNGYTWTKGAFQIIPSVATNITILADSWGAQVDYTQTSNYTPWIEASAVPTSVITLKGFTFDNNSTDSGNHITDSSSIVRISDLRYELPDIADTGIYTTNQQSKVEDVIFVSGGTTNTYALNIQDCIANNIRFNGTFTNASTVFLIDSRAQGTNITANGNMLIELNGGLNGFKRNNGTPNITLNNNNAELVDVDLQNGTLNASAVNSFGCSNTKIGTYTDGVNTRNARFSSTSFVNATTTINGDKNTFAACKFSGLTVASGGDSNVFSACYASGNVLVSGNYNCLSVFNVDGTCTINTGATANVLANCPLDNGYTDNGTGTIIISNTQY